MGRAIEADIKDSDEETLTIMVGLQHESVGTSYGQSRAQNKDHNMGPQRLYSPNGCGDRERGCAIPAALDRPPLATLPAIPLTDTTLECGFTTGGDSNWDEVVLSFTHTPATVNGWELVGYYRQLFYPPDYGRGRRDASSGTRPLGHQDFETSASFQHYYAQAQVYDAEAEVVAVYEKDGRRLGARRTIGCTGGP